MHDDLKRRYIQFGPFIFDSVELSITKKNEVLPFESRHYSIIKCLIDKRPEIVRCTDACLSDTLSSQPEVNDKRRLLTKYLSELCGLMGKDEYHTNIENVSKKRDPEGTGGYKFVGKITSYSTLRKGDLRQTVPNDIQMIGLDSLPTALRTRIDDLKVSPAINQALVRVLTSDTYPDVMTLSNEAVLNPIWGFISPVDRTKLASTFSPFGSLPPRIMHLDIFLLKSNDKAGRPYLFNYFSGKPVSGWQAFMLPFRHRKPGEDEDLRQRENAKDIASFFEVDPKILKVESLGDQFVVSVKPDPGYSELVVYIFEFCSVRMESAPRWMKHIDCELKLKNYVRRFRWCHPEEMELPDRSVLVDGDVLRGVHYFFFTTIPSVPVGFPVVLPT